MRTLRRMLRIMTIIMTNNNNANDNENNDRNCNDQALTWEVYDVYLLVDYSHNI